MESYRVENLTFGYPGRARPALDGVRFAVERGSFVTLCGASGCGKTTLLRQLKPALAPHGIRSGAIHFEGEPLDALSKRDGSAKIGFVTQNPENQIVTDKVWHELAFGLESLGLATPEIRLRVAETASFFGIQTWFHKPVAELSGGQKQLLCLASVMTMQPSVLLLDEPTGRLDPIAASELLATLGKINRELGVTVVLSEHRLEEAFAFSDRVIVLDSGRVLADGAPRDVGARLRERGSGMFFAMPAAMRIWAGVGDDSPCPVTVREGRAWLENRPVVRGAEHGAGIGDAGSPRFDGTPAAEFDDVWFRYGRREPDTLKALSFKIRPGEWTAILGGNGTGKTTALSLLARLRMPDRGKIRINGEEIGKNPPPVGTVALLPQDPQALFVKKTVREDLAEVLRGRGLSGAEREARFADAVALCRLRGLLDAHPYDLSGGEQQRAALAKLLLLRPALLLLDEPTKGIDAAFKRSLAGMLKELTAAGATILMVSHDAEFCAEYADRCALFFDGGVVSEGTPRAFFSGNSFYTSAANRIARDVLPSAVTTDEVVAALGGRPDTTDTDTPPGAGASSNSDVSPGAGMPISPGDTPPPGVASGVTAACPKYRPTVGLLSRTRRRMPNATLAATGMILFVVPLTIRVGLYLFDDRKYYFISLLILLETLLPFALLFEARRPKARELVVIAALCALAVAGRAAFFMLPQFKPVVTLVVLSGVAFGAETGFLVGAVTGFAGNLMFGQGPWTPWQMFALGLIGFLAGLLFRKGLLPRGRVPLATFGGVAAFAVYGGIMNLATVLMYQNTPTRAMLLAAYARGLPFDLVHAAATVIFLLLIARPMLEKLDRIKVKYGLI